MADHVKFTVAKKVGVWPCVAPPQAGNAGATKTRTSLCGGPSHVPSVCRYVVWPASTPLWGSFA